jgi:hypothetical protein
VGLAVSVLLLPFVASSVDVVSLPGRSRHGRKFGRVGLVCSELMVCETRSARVVAIFIVFFGFALLEHPYIGSV